MSSFPFVDCNHATEKKLLLACANAQPHKAIVTELTAQEPDWSYLISTARQHGVLSVVYQSLKSCSTNTISPEVLKSLDKYFYLNSSRNLYQAETLLELLEQLESQDVSAVPYKGPVLCCQAYGSLGFREFGDLDILVRSEDLSKARAILEKCGYRSTLNLTHEQEKAFLASNHAYSMIRQDDKTVVELHWRFTPRYFTHELDLDEIWGRLTEVALNGTHVPALCPEDLILILCAHGTKHCWDRLLYICDVAHLICAHPQINWDAVIRRAKNSGGLRMLNTGLLSAHQLLGTEVPNRVKKEIEKDEPAKSLAAQIGERLFEKKKVTGELVRVPFHLKARERLKDKILYLVLFLSTPTLEDFKTFQLPASLFLLYKITRPLRLFILSVRRKYRLQYETT